MAKRKEKRALFETVQFQDLKRAQREVAFAKINQIRILIGFLIACIATYLAISGFRNQENTWVLGFGLGIFSYLVGGGILMAIKFAWKLTVIGWFMIPVFPVDLAICLAFFFLSLYGLAFLPVIFIGLNFIQQKKNLDAAQRYLAQCGRSVSQIAAE